MRSIFLAALLIIFLGCSSEEPDLQLTQNHSPLQSYELHYPWAQVDYDSLFYEDGLLVRHQKTSTGWIDVLNYTVEYQGPNIELFLTQNGTPSVDFVRKDVFEGNRIIQTVNKKSDGSLFSIYDYLYDVNELLIAQKVTSEGQQFTDSIRLDAAGNVVLIKRVEDGSEIVMTYDQQPNPFYKLPLINSAFRTESPNNITSFQIYYADTLFYHKSYQYQYSSDGYPTQAVVQGSLPSDAEERFFFYY